MKRVLQTTKIFGLVLGLSWVSVSFTPGARNENTSECMKDCNGIENLCKGECLDFHRGVCIPRCRELPDPDNQDCQTACDATKVACESGCASTKEECKISCPRGNQSPSEPLPDP